MTLATGSAAPARRAQPGVALIALAAAAAFLLAVAAVVGGADHGRLVAPQLAGAAIGLGAGLTLYHASFGFTGGWRRLVLEGRGRGFRMQLALLACVCAVSLPLLGAADWLWDAYGLRVGGFVFPFGWGALAGAVMFGVGMQFGGGCGSGTLFTAGGGSTRMTITLGAFVAGSLLGTAHIAQWAALPRLPAYSFVEGWGAGPTVLASLAVLGLLWAGSVRRERRLHGRIETGSPVGSWPTGSWWTGSWSMGSWPSGSWPSGSWLRGPWSPWAGVAGLTLVCIATFLLVGRPWGVTSGFALWGAKGASMLGVPVENWPYWRWQAGALERSVLHDTTSVMNIGVMLGALLAAGLAGRHRPTLRIEPSAIATALLGGLLMGYGARLSGGCNIGALLGGISSGSLHGWLWFAAAFAGSAATVIARDAWTKTRG